MCSKCQALDRGNGQVKVISQEPILPAERGVPLELHALLDEAALWRLVGGLDVMSDQLTHLLGMSLRHNVTVQVIPLAAGAYGAMSGPFFLLSFPEDDEPDAAYVESLTGMATVENEHDVASLSAVWDGAAAAALSIEESVELIREAKVKGP